MKTIKVLIILSFIFLFCSCNYKRNVGFEIFGDFAVVSNLDDYEIITSDLLYPTGIVLLDSVLFINEYKSDPMIVCNYSAPFFS